MAASVVAGLGNSLPVWCSFIESVHALVLSARPAPFVIVAVLRRSLQLVYGDPHDVAAEAGIVLQTRPRRGIMIVADAEKTTVAQDGIRTLPDLLSIITRSMLPIRFSSEP